MVDEKICWESDVFKLLISNSVSVILIFENVKSGIVNIESINIAEQCVIYSMTKILYKTPFIFTM